MQEMPEFEMCPECQYKKTKYENCEIECHEVSCDYCNNSLMFKIEDKFHIGIITILECLKIAEAKYHVPELPTDWWEKLARRYNIEMPKNQNSN